MSFSGAVLAGGRSSRMGTDKALVEIGGVPLAGIVRRVLLQAGAAEVLAIGGDSERLAALGFDPHPDSSPGEGPLGGIVDALTVASEPVVVVLACDQPEVDAALVERLVSSIDETYEAAVPVVHGRPHPLTAAYATRALTMLRAAFTAGERAPRRALARLRWRALDDVDPARVRDVDDPADLARYAAPGQIGTGPSTRDSER